MSEAFLTSAVIDGVCYGFAIWKSEAALLFKAVWTFASFYLLPISIFVFCYGKILIVVRRQAVALSALTLMVGRQKEYLARKN